MEGKPIKNRLYQTLGQRSPKHAFLLEEGSHELAPTLKPKKMQDAATLSHAKSNPIFKQGKLVLNQLTGPEISKKIPQQVEQEKLSKEARSMIEEGKQRIRSNLKPHDIFQLYQNFPEMMEDFFYLNRMEHPYDYQIVTYANRNPAQYMTISSQGVTLYHDKQAQFLSRQKWLGDEKRYYALQKINFFRQYKISKNFRIWKNRMRRHYMREMSGILNEHLFVTMKYPRNCLLKIKNYTNILRETLHFFPFDSMDKLSSSEFVQLLDEHREKTLLKGIRQITQAITECLCEAVNQEINKFRSENNIRIEGVNEGQSGNKEGYVYSQEAILKKQYKRVYKLIKLADGMLQQAKIQMVLRCLQQLVDKIRELQTEDREPWIVCTASIDLEGGVHWMPCYQDLCSLFLEAIKKNIKKMNELNEKIVNNAVFAKYRVADSSEGKVQETRNSLKSMVEDSPNYFKLLEEIEGVIVEQFNSTKKEQKALQKFIEIYMRHRQLETIATIFKESNGVELCNYVDQWKRDEKEMSQLSEDKKGKMLLYNYSQFRRNIINLPKQTLASFFSLLPEETSIRCRDLIVEAKSLFDSISSYPTDIVSFAKFNKAVKLAAERLEDIRSGGSQICLLIDLMGRNKMGNMQTFNGKKVEVLNSISILKSKVEESEAKENESLSRFKRENEIEIGRIKLMAKELQSKFNGIEFNQIKATAKEMKQILSKIRQILPSVKALQSQSRKITEIQIDLNLIQTDFTDVHRLYENTLLINDTWSCRDDWKNLLINLYHKHYTEVDCLTLRQKWEEFEGKISTLIKTLPENQILKNLTQELSEVEVLIDTISALKSPNLEEKSWREISEYLAYELGIQSEADFPFRNSQDPAYTVKWLLEINIPVYKEKIEFIVRKSQKEKELVIQLADFKNYLSSLVFETVQKKNEFYIFSQNWEVQEKIHHNLNELYTMLNSQYSQSVQSEAETLIKHYEYVEEIIKAILDFAEVWSHFEPFFDLNSGSLKFLAKESKEFTSWEAQWKKIIKNITADSLSFYRKVCDETLGVNCSRSTIKQIVKINGAIEQIKKGLQEYLQRKRASFPRYYFVPDSQLLQMLGSIDPKEPITAHFVPIIYKHIDQIKYKFDSKDTLLSIVSKEGEEFELKQINFKLQSQMEEIFKLTEEQIKKRIGYLIKNVFLKYTDEDITRKQMILENNIQVVLAVDFIAWVRLAEETYLCPDPIGDLFDWINIQEEQIKELKDLLRDKQDKITTNKLVQLMSQALYMRQKTSSLLKDNISSIDCYEWERIPKLCMTANNNDVYFKQLYSKLNYCYEFLGSSALSFIEPQTEKVWLNIAQTVISRDTVYLKSQDPKIQTVKKLGFMIAQEVEQINIGQSMNFNVVERFISGGIFVGHWVAFNCPKTEHMLAFISNQLNNVRKILLDNSFEKTKSSTSGNHNLAFFLVSEEHQKCNIQNLLNTFSHRDITLYAPSWLKICQTLAECYDWPREAAEKVISVCTAMRDCFKNNYYEKFSHQFVRRVFERVMGQMGSFDWLKKIKCSQEYEFMTCEVFDNILLPQLSREDIKIYETVKSALVIDYEKIKLRHPSSQAVFNKEITACLESKGFTLASAQYVYKVEAFKQALTSNKLGVIISGGALSGKTTLIKTVCELVKRQANSKINTHIIYPNAYTADQIFKIKLGAAILPQALNSFDSINWVVFDGVISAAYIEVFGRKADQYMIPEAGIFSHWQHVKMISETNDISEVPPSIVENHLILSLGQDCLTHEQIIRKQVWELQQKGQTVNISAEALEYLINGLCGSLGKLQSKTIFKNRLISLAYPIANLEITYHASRLLRSIFSMNWESIRDKEKNIKKLIDRFIAWTLFWSLLGIVSPEDQSKLQKLIVEVAKADSFAPDQLLHSIIYPNCGLEVQLISGLRTQSSLGIPEKGIITNVLRTDLGEENQNMKSNKFFQQIVISEAHLIRVNYQQSNKFNYLAQVVGNTETPMMMIGPQNSGKKTILELYAKNMRSKSQFYSIRYRDRKHLSGQIQRPFRSLNGLTGLMMKSVTASKKLIISIQDVSLDLQNNSSVQLFRMLFSERGFYNDQAQWMTFINCSFNLIVSKLSHSTDSLRLLHKIKIFQTANNSSEKLHSIYYPYLKNWAAFNGLGGDVQKIFSSENGDTLLDGIISIYKLLDTMYCGARDRSSLESLMMRPRIADISRVLAYICRTPEANHYNMAYYYQLWVHEVVRVFGDRLSSAEHKQMFFKELRKQALIKFKENFNLNEETMFVFTSLGIENQQCYIRVQDPAYIHNYISNLLEADEISVPLKYLFSELLNYLLRIYRIIAVQGTHLLLFAKNQQTVFYLIKLACQIGQNEFYRVDNRIISVQSHIEPTLYLKQNICLSGNIDEFTDEAIYQMACLLNSNFYEFSMEPSTKQRMKVNLNKREKVEASKKEAKVVGKSKMQQGRNQQKQDQIEQIMIEQFMSYTHYVLYSSPLSERVRSLLKNNSDIGGKFHFSWVDFPQNSLVKVSRQILSFDQELQELALVGYNDDKLIEKVRKIFASQTKEDSYFNDFLSICETVKSQNIKQGNAYALKEKQIRQGKECLKKVKDSIVEKEKIIKRIHQELEETNAAIEMKNAELESTISRISQLQLTLQSEDQRNQLLMDLKVAREEIEIDLKLLRDKKDKLEPQKKKILKSIKIGSDYLDIFNNSFDFFDENLKDMSEKILFLQDKLILCWCSITYLSKKSIDSWLQKINQWMQLIDSKMQKLTQTNQIEKIMDELMPQPQLRKDLFAEEIRVKIKALFWLINHYEETVFYGETLKIWDPKKLMPDILQGLSSASISSFSLIKIYSKYHSQLGLEIETLCKSRNGLIIFESSEGVNELEKQFSQKKMVSYLSKIIVLSDQKKACLILDCSSSQLSYSVQNFILKKVNFGLHNERKSLYQQLAREEEKVEETTELFYRACANINFESQTYIQQISKYKGMLAGIEELKRGITIQANNKSYLKMQEFEMLSSMVCALENVWEEEQASLALLQNVYMQSLKLIFGPSSQQKSADEKTDELKKIVQINVGSVKKYQLSDQLNYMRPWSREVKIILIEPSRAMLNCLGGIKKLNLMTIQPNELVDSKAILYNYVKELHQSLLAELIDKKRSEAETQGQPIILMAEEENIKGLALSGASIIPSGLQMARQEKLAECALAEVKEVQNVMKFLKKRTDCQSTLKGIEDMLNKNSSKMKSRIELKMLILDIIGIATEGTVEWLMENTGNDLELILTNTKENWLSKEPQIEPLDNELVSANIKQQLPFAFNISEFIPSKDPFSAELISECLKFNRKLKIARARGKQQQLEWEERNKKENWEENEEQIQKINLEYVRLKKNLAKLQMLPSNFSSFNGKNASIKIIASPAWNYPNMLNISKEMANSRTLCLLKCRAAKKFKTKLSSVVLSWRYFCESINFQQIGGSPELCAIVEAALCNEFIQQKGARDKRKEVKKLSLLIVPYEEAKEMKSASQLTTIAIKQGQQILGCLEIGKTELDSEKLSIIEKTQFFLIQ